MRKLTGTIISLALIAAMAISYSCIKEDTNPPVITIIGNNPFIIDLQNTGWTDPGATAYDDEDGDITDKITKVTEVNPNFQATTYKITYSVTDDAGNSATAVRNVHVINSAAVYAGSYSGTIKDAVGTVVYTYLTPELVTTDNTKNNRVHFAKFGGYNPNDVYADISGANITVPYQLKTNVAGADRGFQGTGTISVNKDTLIIDFTETVGSLTDNFKVTYVKQ